MKKVIALILVLIIGCFTLASCNNQSNGTRIIKDINGDEVTIPANPARIVCRSGNGTSFLIGMEYADRLVGTADYVLPNPWVDFFAPNVSNIAKFKWQPSAEELYATNADLIMFPDGEITANLRESGLTAVCYKQYNEEEMLESVELLKEIFSEDENAQSYLTEWKNYYDEIISYIAEKIKDVPMSERPVVHYVYAASNKGVTRTVGGGGIYETWAEHSGAILATKDYPVENERVSEEELLAINPDFIMIGGMSEHIVAEELLQNEAWSNADAIKNGNVYTMPIAVIPWDMYGVEYPLWILWTAKILYPELIDKDMVEETREFYKQFFDVELSDTQINYILSGKGPDGTKISK